jgi:effector-binding domain-containing protein
MVQNVKYEVVKKLGKVEIRRYPKIVIAKVANSEADNFGLLFKFISGNNVQKEKVQMTAPVVTQNASQEIKMTAPVLSDFSNQGYMAFVMPAEFSLETTPLPLDNRVTIKEVPSRLVAVLRFSGSWSEAHFEEKSKELLQELANAKVKTAGKVFSMLYNPPFTPGFLRRNEVAIEVKDESVSA